MTMPGLETLAFSEVRATVEDAELVKFARGVVLFRTTAVPEKLLELRTVEDVFFMLEHITGLGHGPDALRVLHSASLRADIATALLFWRRVRTGKRAKTWRVVSQMVGTHGYRRVDAGQSVKDALRRVFPTTMRLVDDEADVEVWLWLNGSEAVLGVRLSDATMRHRAYKREHLPASLRPTVAAAMCWLSQPTPDDIVLDPLCGAGTILIERALLAPYETLIGGDKRREAVTVAEHNVKAARVAVELHAWDARSLPLDAASVTRVITNLPFGKQIGTHAENQALYKALLKAFTRVLTPDGLLVTLTSEDRLWESVMREQGWILQKKVVCVILGQPASIFVAHRSKTGETQ